MNKKNLEKKVKDTKVKKEDKDFKKYYLDLLELIPSSRGYHVNIYQVKKKEEKK